MFEKGLKEELFFSKHVVRFQNDLQIFHDSLKKMFCALKIIFVITLQFLMSISKIKIKNRKKPSELENKKNV